MRSDKEKAGLTRRKFMRDSAMTAAGLSVGLGATGCQQAQRQEAAEATADAARTRIMNTIRVVFRLSTISKVMGCCFSRIRFMNIQQHFTQQATPSRIHGAGIT